MTRVSNIENTPKAAPTRPPLSPGDFSRFSDRSDINAQAEEKVLGSSVKVAGLSGVVRWAARALGRASDNIASGVGRGHMRNHFRRLASQPGKSIFRNPSKAPKLVNTALREARDIALKNADDLAAGKVVRSGATEIAQQGNRLAVTRNMGKAIGKDGENMLRVVVGKTGQIVTAYPVRSTAAAGAFFGATGVGQGKANAMYNKFDSQVAKTIEEVQGQKRGQGFDLFNELVGILDPLGLFYSEPANGQEAIWLATKNGADAALKDIESGLGRRLSDTERSIYRQRFVEAVQTGVGIQAEQ
ncbi:MAG: hypothetical protein AAFN74_03735 [Myxococcota bacterium]